jgi:hypothetical protein
VSRLAKRPAADHGAMADTLRETPGVWRSVHTYRSKFSADGIAHGIRSGLRFYGPAGSFEARVEYDPDGEPVVVARYVGADR